MRSTYRTACPVPLSDLRYLRLSYHGFDGRRQTGELVVSAEVATQVLTVFRTLYDQGFPIRSMRPVSDFNGSDDASMGADNTSAFNCRRITGGSSWSEHSYGDAVDINPRENPQESGGAVLPTAGAAFAGRPDAPGVIHPDDLVVRAFTAIGWTWGGSWSSPVDLQHFSRNGR
ncbi:MAG: M15 family metallopeptidase [Actinomycetota bacterium]|nr:M15 family metallopeptidase [Actinomycetota bacterium]